MSDIERSASFYIGKVIDPQTGTLGDIVQYDARDLTTHAVCLGMTGSGKTGLCIDLLEEATLDGIPSIIIDPKGDMTNLLLTFPELRPADFLPWINLDDASREGLTPQEYAEKTAQKWAEGLAKSGIEPARIRRLRDSAEFIIFTPGSDSGVKVSILQSLAAPELSWDDHEEELREKIVGTVDALLALAGIKNESLRSRGQLLLAHLFERAWRDRQDLDLALLIQQIQKPPMRRLGAFDTDTYFPPSDRMQLAIALNNLIASPSFSSWMEGMPLDIGQITRAADGRPRVSIFYLAHLNDDERSFFVTLLLQQVIVWMRTLSGTTSLRTIVYFDEVFGYFPPYPANPPTKTPILTLLKQARAFGIGVVLVTQNPFDLDYKGLTNAGTWIIGKLQTDRDKMRVLEALDGLAAGGGPVFERGTLDRLIGSLKSRVFILHNVHQKGPIVMTSRWAMSYLRGPLTRSQIRGLMKESKPRPVEEAIGAQSVKAGGKPLTAASLVDRLDAAPPTLSPDLPQFFLPTPPQPAGSNRLIYRPAVFGLARIRYVHPSSDIDVQKQVAYLLPAAQIGTIPDWSGAEEVDLTIRDLGKAPASPARFAEVPAEISEPGRIKALQRAFQDFLIRDRSLVVKYNRSLKLYARPDESEREFAKRCQELARNSRDAELEKVRKKFESKIKTLEERIRREELELARDRAEYEGRKREELLSAGESVFSILTGRKLSRVLSQGSRKRRLTTQAKEKIAESEAMIKKLQQELDLLKQNLTNALSEVNQNWAAKLDDVQETRVTPQRTNVAIEVFGLAWVPHWES